MPVDSIQLDQILSTIASLRNGQARTGPGSTPFEDFVAAAAAAACARVNALEIQVGLSGSGSGAMRWLGSSEWLPAVERDALLKTSTTIDHHVVGELHIVLLNVGRPLVSPSRRPRGFVVGVFDSSNTALQAATSLRKLAELVHESMLAWRKWRDSEALLALSESAVSAATPREALAASLTLLCAQTDSAGAKIHALRRVAGVPKASLLFHSDNSVTIGDFHSLSREAGLVGWVLLNDDWILVETPAAPEQTGKVPEICLTGKHGTVEIFAKPEREPAGAQDRERSMLLMPIRRNSMPVGVISIWRLDGEAYDDELDLASVLRFIPAVSSVCQWVIQSEASQAQADALVSFDRFAANCANSFSLYMSLAEHMSRLGASAGALILYPDSKSFYPLAIHPRNDALRTPIRVAQLDSWATQALVAISARCSAISLAPRPPSSSHIPREGEICYLMLDHIDPHTAGVTTWDDRAASDACYSFLRGARSIIDAAQAGLIARVGHRLEERIGDLKGEQLGDTSFSEAILAEVERVIKELTGADAVLVYSKSARGFSHRVGTRPAEILEEDKLIKRCIEHRTVELLPDISNQSDPRIADVDARQYAVIANHNGWAGVRSVICFPFVKDGRVIGIMRLLTRDRGAFLDPCAITVARGVSETAVDEMQRLMRLAVLDGLNTLATKLRKFRGPSLRTELANELKHWASRFLQTGCEAIVIADAVSRTSRLFASSIAKFDETLFNKENSDALISLSTFFSSKSGRCLSLHAGLEKYQQLCVPIEGRSTGTVAGVLAFLGESSFRSEDESMAKEAAREIAMLLDHVQDRHAWGLHAAKFRHALLGPVQGILSSAQMLALLGTEGSEDVEHINKIVVRMRREAESMRLWRENQRLYEFENIDLKLKGQSLRQFVDRCAERFKTPMEARGIKIKVEYASPGSIDVKFDAEALDLVLSNLLDNALKYSFFNREVIVSVELQGSKVRISVEDIGHGIPPRLKELIYRIGGRLDWKDPIRSIDGSGLGLPMALALVEAHGGRLTHTSEPLGRTDEPEALNKVRFMVELPLRWSAS